MASEAVRIVRDVDMSQTMYRNKNKDKTAIDWDLNIYMPEEFNPDAEYPEDQYYYDPASWRIHVYHYTEIGHMEWDEPLILTAEEIQVLGFNRDSYFKDEVDVWYGLDGFRREYWSKMSDRLKMYFDALPKYYEDIV
jgi:hypothetical protein